MNGSSYCICFPGTPDWTAVSAIATVFLASGVLVALYQLLLQRQADRVIETGKLLQEWNRDVWS